MEDCLAKFQSPCVDNNNNNASDMQPPKSVNGAHPRNRYVPVFDNPDHGAAIDASLNKLHLPSMVGGGFTAARALIRKMQAASDKDVAVKPVASAKPKRVNHVAVREALNAKVIRPRPTLKSQSMAQKIASSMAEKEANAKKLLVQLHPQDNAANAFEDRMIAKAPPSKLPSNNRKSAVMPNNLPIPGRFTTERARARLLRKEQQNVVAEQLLEPKEAVPLIADLGVQVNENEILDHSLLVGDVKFMTPSPRLVYEIDQKRAEKLKNELMHKERVYEGPAQKQGEHLTDLKEFLENAVITKKYKKDKHRHKIQADEKLLSSMDWVIKRHTPKTVEVTDIKTRFLQKEQELLKMFEKIDVRKVIQEKQ